MSVVIPFRGEAAMLSQCLRSVVAQATSFAYEVIVIDSTNDPATAAAAMCFEGVRLVPSRTPLLPGPARNLGAEQALGRLIAFIDADCIAMPGWLAAAHAALEDEDIRIVGGPIGDLLNGRRIAAADNLLQYVDMPATRKRGPARHFPSCNIAMRRDDFIAIGGFADTGLPAGEDVLLCDTLREQSPQGLRFEPGMAVKHTGRTTWRAYLDHHEMFGYCRARFALHLKPWHLRYGRYTFMMPILVLKRLVYILRSGVRHRGWGVWRVVLMLPLVLPGLWYSARGFRRGCREPAATLPEPQLQPQEPQSA